MKYSLLLAFIFTLIAPSAHADQPEAKEVARINNCAPKKIEVYKNTLGSSAKTIYQVIYPKQRIKTAKAHRILS